MTEYHIYPTNPESFRNRLMNLDGLGALGAGDKVWVHQGTYQHTYLCLLGSSGTAGNPITIQRVPGENKPVIDCPNNNVINLGNDSTACSYVKFDGLKVTSTNAVGNGFNVYKGPCNNIQILNSEIYDCAGGIWSPSFAGDSWTIQRNRVYSTGKDGGTGEAMYLGYHGGTAGFTNAVVALNWIGPPHANARTDMGLDGIEIKAGGSNNLIRDNVIDGHVCGISTYGSNSLITRNVIVGNVLLNCTEPIVCCSYALIENNIILGSAVHGITVQEWNPVTQVRDLTIRHNSVYITGTGGSCLKVYHSNANSSNMILANNAFYRSSDQPVISAGTNGSLLAYWAVKTRNYLGPGTVNYGVTIDNSAFYAGESATVAFADPANNQLYPNGFTNPGWTVQAGFKNMLGTAPTGAAVLRVIGV